MLTQFVDGESAVVVASSGRNALAGRRALYLSAAARPSPNAPLYKQMNRRIRHALVLTFFALMTVFAGANAYLTLSPMSQTSVRGWGAVREDGVLRVKRVSEEGPAELKVSDEVLAVRGELGEELDPTVAYPWNVRAGYAYTVEVRRDSQTLSFDLHTSGYPFSNWLAMLLGSLILPVVFITT